MSLPGYVPGMPRIGSVRATSPRIIFRDDGVLWALSGGKVIDGSKSRDPDNTGQVGVLRPGLLMGKITSSGKYAPSIIGKSNAAYAAGATTLTLTSQAVTEISRRIGSSGTFKIVGPPAASGVVAEETVTFSALPSSTTATITALANSYISGALIRPTDGSEAPLSLISEFFNAQTGVPIFDVDGTTELDVPFEWFPIGGVLISANIINYPSDSSLKNWVRYQLSSIPGGKFVFDDLY